MGKARGTLPAETVGPGQCLRGVLERSSGDGKQLRRVTRLGVFLSPGDAVHAGRPEQQLQQRGIS